MYSIRVVHSMEHSWGVIKSGALTLLLYPQLAELAKIHNPYWSL